LFHKKETALIPSTYLKQGRKFDAVDVYNKLRCTEVALPTAVFLRPQAFPFNSRHSYGWQNPTSNPDSTNTWI